MLINTRALLWSNPSPPEKKNHTNAPLFHEGLRVSAGHVTSSQKEPITTLPSFLLLLSWAHARTHCQWEAEECWQLFRLDQFSWCRCFALTPRLQLDTRLVSTSPSHMGCTIVKTFWMRLYEWQRNTQFMCVSALFNLTMNLILKSTFSLTALFAICWQFSSISDHTIMSLSLAKRSPILHLASASVSGLSIEMRKNVWPPPCSWISGSSCAFKCENCKKVQQSH